MASKNTPLLLGLINGKCPKCRQGNIFTHKSVFPLKTCLEVNEYCSHCNNRIKVENNFGQGMNFVFIVIIFVLTGVIYGLTLGWSFKDNSIFSNLGVSIVFCLVVQPWLMRLSRVLFLYLVTPHGKGNS